MATAGWLPILRRFATFIRTEGNEEQELTPAEIQLLYNSIEKTFSIYSLQTGVDSQHLDTDSKLAQWSATFIKKFCAHEPPAGVESEVFYRGGKFTLARVFNGKKILFESNRSNLAVFSLLAYIFLFSYNFSNTQRT